MSWFSGGLLSLAQSSDGFLIRLPTEWEWQQAATGGDPTHRYPWPRGWDGTRCNSTESRLNRTTPVGIYPNGATQQG
ncbi:MAG: SUMF1/EgtB/PvdO family nonheme iron enzyme [Nitrospirales bacterium]|nr:formylglycine-generating enzyme family protein [Nitrospirales bacterium]